MTENVERIDYLIHDKEDLRSKIEQRLILGNNLISKQIQDKHEEQKCWDDFIDWDYYNLELIKQAFEFPNNAYSGEYKRQVGSGGVFFPGTYVKPTLQESAETNRSYMRTQVRKLNRFLEKLDLIKMKPGLLLDITSKNNIIEKLVNMLKRFHKVAQELRDRYSDRDPLIIRDEYDVQYLLKALLTIYFDDVRVEEYSPSNSGANTRLDFVMKEEKVIVETKMTSERLRTKNLGEELLIDIGRYKSYPACDHLILFIYDRGDHINNKRGFIKDIENQSSDKLAIRVIIIPE